MGIGKNNTRDVVVAEKYPGIKHSGLGQTRGWSVSPARPRSYTAQ